MSVKKSVPAIMILIFLIIPVFLFQSCESNDSPVINNTPASNVPVLQSPANNSTVSTLSPVFDWDNVSDALSYILQVSKNNSFTDIVLNVSGISVSNYSPAGDTLNDSTSYFWRVRGVKSTDTTEWSSVFSFAVSLESIDPTNKVLIELYTNTSCIPCVEANQYLDGINNRLGVTNNDPNVIILRVHTTLYSGDPFYEYNMTDNNARMAVYPGTPTSNPRGYLLGAFMSNFSASSWTGKINQKLSETRTFAIKLNNSYDPVSRNGNLDVKIKQVSGDSFSDLVYNVAMTESEIPYNAPNGETLFENTLRDLITPSDGQQLNISPGQTNSYSHAYSVANELNQDHVYLTVFIQRTTTVNFVKEVMAVENVKIK
ncbi:MAG: hypothetical protein JSS91_07395 [Bacteroidetes bacterium]|nr:hypothetical protein [Bacteroidota bacterium]